MVRGKHRRRAYLHRTAESRIGLVIILPRIIRHEWRTLRADKTIWLVTILFACLIGYGIYNGASWVETQEATIRLLTERHEDTVAMYKTEAADYEKGKPSDPNTKPPDSSVYDLTIAPKRRREEVCEAFPRVKDTDEHYSAGVGRKR